MLRNKSMEYITKLDASIPHGRDLAPMTPGNTFAQETREVREKINEIIDFINKISKEALR